MKKAIILTAESFVQILVLIALYPMWVIVGLYAMKSRRDRFNSVSRVCGFWLFPAFGRWWIPMVWLNWHCNC